MRVHCGASGPLSLFEVEEWSTRSSRSPSPYEAAVPPGSFTKEISASQDRDNRFLPATGEDRQLHLALLNVKDRVGGTALREDGSFLSVILGGSPAGLRKVRPEVEWRVFLLCHEPAPILSGVFSGNSHVDLLLVTSLWMPCGTRPSSVNLALRLRRSQQGARLGSVSVGETLPGVNGQSGARK
jgi:hypothetical protein